MKNAGMRGVKDPFILDLAAKQERIAISHDRRTMARFFLDRVALGKPNPRLFIVPQRSAVAEVIESLLLIWTASQAVEWRDLIVYLPLS